jgi:alkanesulfonate monooxygenase SsuD/methylene tetrahydromethanopterin reductase-like flavin-dependent oxidoreductase (luciferase family)
VVGDPETCRKKFQKYKDAGADELILRIDGMPHEKIMDCIRLLAEQVFPHLR